MAHYDFVCRACGHAFEVFSTGFIRDEQKFCPICSSADIQQQYSSFLHSIKAAPSAPACDCDCACAAAPGGCGFAGCE